MGEASQRDRAWHDDERAYLERLARRRKVARGDAQRAAIVLAAAGGTSETALTADEETAVGTRAAGIATVTLAAGAVACGACCVLPLALPAVVLWLLPGVVSLIAFA